MGNKILVMDGVKYKEWIPISEADFENLVKDHKKEIFGKQSIYLDIKPYLKSVAGLGSVPDGLTIIYGENPQWNIIEVELSNHSVYEHIVPQVARFTSGIKNPATQRKVVDVIYNEILKDELLNLRLKKAVAPTEIHKFISDLILNQPILTIIIDKETPELEDVRTALAHLQIRVVEFQTFTREDVGLSVHAHLFEPLYKRHVIPPRPVDKGTTRITDTDEKLLRSIEVVLSKIYAARRWVHIPISGYQRRLFPGFKENFELVTDEDVITTHISSGKAGTPIGDPMEGKRIQGGLRLWYDKHPELKDGATLVIEELEPKKKYRLQIKKSERELR